MDSQNAGEIHADEMVARIKDAGCNLAESYIRNTVRKGVGRSRAIDLNRDETISAEVRVQPRVCCSFSCATWHTRIALRLRFDG